MKKNKGRGSSSSGGDILVMKSIAVPRVRKQKVKPHRRVNDTFLGPLERQALSWLVERLPAWVMPDHLTGLGFLAAILIFVSYILTTVHPAFLWLASLGFVINWFGDSLDGTLARYRKIERPKYGYFIDHSIDALTETLVFLGAGMSPYLRFDIAAVALVGYLLLSIHVFLSTYVGGEFRISYISLGPTEVRLIAILGNSIVFFAGSPLVKIFGASLTAYDLIVSVVAFLLYSIFIAFTVKMGKALAKVESKPQP